MRPIALFVAASLLPATIASAQEAPPAPGSEVSEPWTLVQDLGALVFDPDTAPPTTGQRWYAPRTLAALTPYAVVEGAEAVHVALPPTAAAPLDRARLMQGRLAVRFRTDPSANEPATTVRGRLYLPDLDGERLVAHPFHLDGTRAARGESEAYRAALGDHAAWCAARRLAGGAWWRSRAALSAGDPTRDTDDTELARTFGLLSGGRALAENLRLSDLMDSGSVAAATVPIADVRGINTPELDWSAFARCDEDGIDPLALTIPADHHAVFVPSFRALTALIDELRSNGTPVLDLLESRGEDARVETRYEAQLALELDAVARVLGPEVVRTIAITGGDPYLRTGSDLALIFDCSAPELFERFVLQRITARAVAYGVSVTAHEVAGLDVRGAADSARDLSSWTARCGETVIVTNSLPLLGRIAATAQGDTASLAGLDEYRHFRARYPRGTTDEVAFVVVPDAAIRRWCGPVWRIASARRVRAGAVLAEAAARQLAHRAELSWVNTAALPQSVPDLGAIVAEPSGPRSERYGTVRFMTPIAELSPAYATPDEVAGYERWRRSYESLWTNVFDPIAAQVTLGSGGLGCDLSVLPIALRSEYRPWIDVVGAAQLDPAAGGGHPEALAYGAFALDRDGATVRELEGFMGFLGQSFERPLGWLGDHLTVWLDRDDDLLARANDAQDLDEFLDEQRFELPVGVQIAVRDPLRLSTFLAALKGLVESAAPGVMVFSTRSHTTSDGADRPYVALEPATGAGWDDTPSLYYAIVPGRLIGSLREDVVQRALERFAAPREMTAWRGESVALRLQEGFKDVLAVGLVERQLRERLRSTAFMALPILNELRALAPDSDPVETLAQSFGATVRCPGGGTWVWDAEHGTYASTVFGCPAAPRDGVILPAAVQALRSAAFGLGFERLPGEAALFGIRARALLQRD